VLQVRDGVNHNYNVVFGVLKILVKSKEVRQALLYNAKLGSDYRRTEDFECGILLKRAWFGGI
jgi:hypothetical protein